MSEELKEVEMYAYVANGVKLWTSNLVFAQMRARHYGTNDIYVEVVAVEN